jgi:FixJ family two-component response regulator
MENRRSFVAVVDDEESVRRALLRLLRAANLDAEAFAAAKRSSIRSTNSVPTA